MNSRANRPVEMQEKSISKAASMWLRTAIFYISSIMRKSFKYTQQTYSVHAPSINFGNDHGIKIYASKLMLQLHKLGRLLRKQRVVLIILRFCLAEIAYIASLERAFTSIECTTPFLLAIISISPHLDLYPMGNNLITFKK